MTCGTLCEHSKGIKHLLRNLSLRLRKIAYGLATPQCRRGLRLGIGASIEHKAALNGWQFRSIIDVGANRGQFVLFAHTEFPDARIVSFEPLTTPAQTFEALFKNVRGISLYRLALGQRSDAMFMHVTQKDDSSSILRPSAQVAVFGTHTIGRENVKVARLDSILNRTDIERPALLKIDTQGYELEVIRGCGDLLSAFDCLYVELSFVELYEGQPLYEDVASVLVSKGFKLAGTFNQSADDNGMPLQADFLFVNAKV